METKAIDTVELVRRHRILKGSSLKEAYEAVKDGWYENAPAAQIASLLSVNKQLLKNLERVTDHLEGLHHDDTDGQAAAETEAYIFCARAALLAAKASS